MFDPSNVNLDTASQEDIICYLSVSGNDYNGQLGARISSIFVILVVSSVFTFFPVVSKRMPGWKIPHGVYLFARYFGTGVIVATAFIICSIQPMRTSVRAAAWVSPETGTSIRGVLPLF